MTLRTTLKQRDNIIACSCLRDMVSRHDQTLLAMDCNDLAAQVEALAQVAEAVLYNGKAGDLVRLAVALHRCGRKLDMEAMPMRADVEAAIVKEKA